MPAGTVNIVGAGPTGALLSILLQRRGYAVALYESRPDPRESPVESGRSINLALADRGIHALKLAGVYEQIAPVLMPMRGRLVHDRDGTRSLHPYGQRPSEVIYSISRHRLNQVLLNAATRPGISLHFEHRLERVDVAQGSAYVRACRSGALLTIPTAPLLATDGAGSLVRRQMAAEGLIRAEEVELDHGYKELSIPAGPGGRYSMAPDALHIWPRGNFMLIALPNIDGSFTATLFLSKHGALSFETLRSPAAIEGFLAAHFADVHPLMPRGIEEFQANPVGVLGTVYASPWHLDGKVALLGDAAHAIVPFHGQGMNCCFEDCVAFEACLGGYEDWDALFADFSARRKPDTDAIATMALENYEEMRARVVDPRFRLQQALALQLERRHPHRFIPRYSMVMFHHEIAYRTALERGAIQSRLLAELTATAASLEDVDLERADREVTRRLAAVPG